jgi:CBS domain-containing protein
MNNTSPAVAPSRLILQAETAADLMTPNPVSVRDMASVHEAIALLIEKGFSAAPVIDEAGHPIGVLSRADILVHDREKVEYLAPAPEFYHTADLTLDSGEVLSSGFQVERFDATKVADLMTPIVFSVSPKAPAASVVDEMLALKVHRLFVIDENGVLVGVISAQDILRHLGAEGPGGSSHAATRNRTQPLGFDTW